MTDRELLELAAKAGYGAFGNQMIESGWNPLKDDGAALRLAVKLGLEIRKDFHKTHVMVVQDLGTTFEEYGNDPYAATRRAVVRAAAAIGVEK